MRDLVGRRPADAEIIEIAGIKAGQQRHGHDLCLCRTSSLGRAQHLTPSRRMDGEDRRTHGASASKRLLQRYWGCREASNQGRSAGR
jgi:hypothetical protein